MIPPREQILKGLVNPRRAAGYLLKPAYRNASVWLTSRLQFGTHIFEEDWKICIILDTCRVDALSEVAAEYDYINDVDWRLSLGGSSPEWMVHTFDTDWRTVLNETAYLTSNSWAEVVLNDRLGPDNHYSNFRILSRLVDYGSWNIIQAYELGRLEKVWKYLPDSDRMSEDHDPAGLMPGGAPPRYVTDRAISVAREYDYDRLILHYMQPHAPYLAKVITHGREPYSYEKQPFDYLRETGRTTDVWDAYLDELRFVLDDLTVLLRNVDAEEVVITSDHGEAFGEYNVYNHHTGSLHPKVRAVPWVKTSGEDTRSYSPRVEPQQQTDTGIEERLTALGYQKA